MAVEKICNACGHLGPPTSRTRGNLLTEIILWLCLIIPGLIYSIWRHATRYEGCRACGGAELLPVDSPRGLRLVRELHPDIAPQDIHPNRGAVGAGRVIGRAVGALMRK